MTTIEKTRSFIPSFSDEALKLEISKEYTQVACNKDHVIHFTSGLPLTKRLRYSQAVIAELPEEAIRPFAGVGNPHQVWPIKSHESILDIGCGAGLDLLYAWANGLRKQPIYGIDITEAMLEKAKANTKQMHAHNIEIIKGYAEKIPLPDNSVDVVISNGVINLCTDKLMVYQEIKRVLKPGGRFQIADVMLDKPVPNESRDILHLWTNCVAGGIPMQDYVQLVQEAGFSEITIGAGYDVFEDARIAKSAQAFGAKGYNITGKLL